MQTSKNSGIFLTLSFSSYELALASNMIPFSLVYSKSLSGTHFISPSGYISITLSILSLLLFKFNVIFTFFTTSSIILVDWRLLSKKFANSSFKFFVEMITEFIVWNKLKYFISSFFCLEKRWIAWMNS